MNLLTKNPMKRNVLMVAAWLWSCCLMAQAPAPVGPLPTQNQVDWQRMETYAFIHFGPNTFGDREWGYGDAPVESFAPTRLDCEQWAKTVKEAGMKGIILTAKHHDGFCLWPTKYTDYSVRNAGVNRGYEGTRVRGDENSSSAEGNLAPPYPRTPAPPNNLASFDVVGSLAAACKKYGLKLGLYLSPWDRHQAFYGTPLYVEYFHAQLEELLTQYGELFEVWFDGANGGDGWYGGAKETRKIDRRTYYDYARAHDAIARLQPHAVIFSDGGPGCRWVGNEEGHADATNWSFLRIKEVYPGYEHYKELQSGHADGDTWVASECNTSIRPGWFYHEREDSKVKSVADLTDLYYRSVGHNGTFLLNFPVDKDGLIHPIDSAHAVDYHKQVASELSNNLLKKAKVKASSVRNGFRGYESTGVRGYENSGKGNLAPSHPRTLVPSKNLPTNDFGVKNLTDGNFDTYWATPDGVKTATLDITFKGRQRLNRLMLQEYIPLGQRVKRFSVEYLDGKNWLPLKVNEATTTIGYKRLLRFKTITTNRLRIRFEEARGPLCINGLGAYYAPNALEKYDENGNRVSEDAERAQREAAYSLPYERVYVVGDMKVNGILLDFGQKAFLHSLHYKPEESGIITNYELYAGDSPDSMNLIASGEFSNIRNNPIMQDVYFSTTQARYLLLRPTRMVVEGEQPKYEQLLVR